MTPTPRIVPQAGPAAWTADGLAPSDWMIPVSADDLPIAPAAPSAFVQRVLQALGHGRGFALLRGLDLAALEAAGTGPALLAIASQFGTPLPQDAAGHLVRPAEGPAPGVAADAILLLCLAQPAADGGVTLVAASSLHNALMKSDRAALAELYAPLPQPEPRAVFAVAHGVFAGRYEPALIDRARLTAGQSAALAALEGAAAAPGQALTLPLHAGDLVLYNPGLVWPWPGEAPPALLQVLLAKPGG